MVLLEMPTYILLNSRVDQTDDTRVRIFIGLQLFGLVGLLAMLSTTVFSSSVQRHFTWYNFSVSWIISSVSYCLLLFGGQLGYEVPTYQLCAAQAALVYGAPVLMASTTVGIVLQIWFTFSTFLTGPMDKSIRRAWDVNLLLVPYILWFAIIVEVLIIAAHEPEGIGKTGSGMYCNSANPIPGRITTGIVVILLVPMLFIEGLIARMMKRNWAVFKESGQTLTMVVRIGIFSLFGLFAVILSLVFFFMLHHGADLNIVVATLPAAAVLIFSTQKDILQSWMFWKKNLPNPETLQV